MHNKKSLYSRNKRNSRAIIYPDAFEQDHPLTPEQFSSEEEFRFWKMWSDENYHGWELADHIYSDHGMYLRLFLVGKQSGGYGYAAIQHCQHEINKKHPFSEFAERVLFVRLCEYRRFIFCIYFCETERRPITCYYAVLDRKLVRCP